MSGTTSQALGGRRPGSTGLGFTLERGMRVGLYGGSFDPAHEGHAYVARTALGRLGLDRVIWLVSPQNPLKPPREAADLAGRMASARRLARQPRMLVSDLETRLGGGYTIDTLRWLKIRYPRVHFVWIMGADNLADFHRWRSWADILRLMPVVVVDRPGVGLKGRFARAAKRFPSARRPARQARQLALSRPPAWVYLTAPLNAMSSTLIRRQARGISGAISPDETRPTCYA